MPARTLLASAFSALLSAAFIGYMWQLRTPMPDLSGLPTAAPEALAPLATSTATSTAGDVTATTSTSSIQ